MDCDEGLVRPGTAHALEASGLACRRGGRLLFQGLNFALGAGEWMHVRGANGAGKTSLLRLVAGLARPEAGSVCWLGGDVVRCDDDARRAIAYLGHRSGMKDDLSALENLRLAAAIDGSPLSEADALAALVRLGLRGREDLPLRALSQGQRRRALLARLVARPAHLWILDEPFVALDGAAVDLVGELLSAHVAAGGMAVLTSHQTIPLAGGAELRL